MVSPFMSDEEKLAAVRNLLPATGAGIYLNAGTAGPIPSESAAAMAEFADWEVRTGRAHPDHVDEVDGRAAEARATVAAILHADVDAIRLTHGTTDGLREALWSLDWRPGDRLLTSDLEHPGVAAVAGALRHLGVELVAFEVDPEGREAPTLEAVERSLHDRTRAILVPHVTWATGARLPVEAITRLAHARGAVVAIDGAQAAGAIPVDVDSIDADVYAVSARKWLLGPAGLGALWVASRRGAASGPGVGVAGLHAPSVVGLARSCGWLAMYVGLDWIAERGAAMAARAIRALQATENVEVLTPAAAMATLVAFRIAGWPARAAARELGARVFAIAAVIDELDAIRISTGFFNTDGEIDRFCGAVAELARHTPETLPPRRLLVLGQDA